MRVTISVDVQDYEQCPHHKSEKVYTADSFENVKKVCCSKLKKNIHSYLNWNETATIPNDCPYLNVHE